MTKPITFRELVDQVYRPRRQGLLDPCLTDISRGYYDYEAGKPVMGCGLGPETLRRAYHGTSVRAKTAIDLFEWCASAHQMSLDLHALTYAPERVRAKRYPVLGDLVLINVGRVDQAPDANGRRVLVVNVRAENDVQPSEIYDALARLMQTEVG